MAILLPIGAEFEYEFPLAAYGDSSRVSVFTYRVVDHVSALIGAHTDMMEQIEPISSRHRNVTGMYSDGVDAFGRLIWRINLDGEGPHPTRQELLDKIGIEVTDPNPRTYAEVMSDLHTVRRKHAKRRT